MARNIIVPVLMYHHVTPEGGFINATPEHFRDQLAWMRQQGYQSVTCAQLADHLAGKPLPERSVLITFDDGYLDNYVYAWPLLKEFGFNAVVFLVTSWIGEGPARVFAGSATDTELPATPDHLACMQLLEQGRTDDFALRWSEVQLMQADGVIEFHSHTHTHTRWDKVAPVEKNERIQQELRLSRQTLVERLGNCSEHLCWPQGYFDEDYVHIAQEEGFRYLYTTRAFGQNRVGSDPLSIFRFAVRDTNGASLGRRLKIAADPVLGRLFNAWKRWKRGQRYIG